MYTVVNLSTGKILFSFEKRAIALEAASLLNKSDLNLRVGVKRKRVSRGH